MTHCVLNVKSRRVFSGLAHFDPSLLHPPGFENSRNVRKETGGPTGLLSSGGPVQGEELGLFKNSLGGFLLFVGGIAVLAEDALDDHPQIGPDVFANRPVDGTLFRTALTSSRAIVLRVLSPRTFTALSFVSKAS